MNSSRSYILYVQIHITNYLLSGGSIEMASDKIYNGGTFDKSVLYKYILIYMSPRINPNSICGEFCENCKTRNTYRRNGTWFTCSLLVYINKVLSPIICSKNV